MTVNPDEDFAQTAPIVNVQDDPEELLSSPFVLVRVADYDENNNPLFKIYFGAGMQPEDVPYIAEMLHDIFPVHRYQGVDPDGQEQEEQAEAGTAD